MRQDKRIEEMAKDFVFLRIVKMNGINLSLFRFDYDLTWMAFFMDADGRVYSRYGGRDATSAEARLSADGLLHTMTEVLQVHKQAVAKKQPAPKLPPPSTPEEMPRLASRKECIHCHQVNEAIYDLHTRQAAFKREDLFTYPLPETVGVQLDLVVGNRVKEVTPGSPAAKSGLLAGDQVRSANQIAVLSNFDFQSALNDVGSNGKLTLELERDGKPLTLALDLTGDWRKCDVSWRKSVHHMQPRIPGLFGRQLGTEAKSKLRIPADGFAWEITTPTAGLQLGDIVVSVDGKRKLPYRDLRGYFPLECKKGDKVELVVLRDGKETPTTLKLP